MEPTAEREASAGRILKELMQVSREWLGLEMRAAREEVRDEAEDAVESAAFGGVALLLGAAGLTVIGAGLARAMIRTSPLINAITGAGLLSAAAGAFAWALHVAPTDAPKRLAHAVKEEAEAVKEAMK